MHRYHIIIIAIIIISSPSIVFIFLPLILIVMPCEVRALEEANSDLTARLLEAEVTPPQSGASAPTTTQPYSSPLTTP